MKDIIFDFFICYSRIDSINFASEINLALKKLGLKSFCDIHDDPNFELEEKIYEKLESSEKLIFIVSPQSIRSIEIVDSWISKELQFAENRNKPIYVINLLPNANLEHLERKFSCLRIFAFVYDDLTPKDFLALLKPLSLVSKTRETQQTFLQRHHIERRELIKLTSQVIDEIHYYNRNNVRDVEQIILREFPYEKKPIPISDVVLFIESDKFEATSAPIINSLIAFLVLKTTRNTDIDKNIPLDSNKVLFLISKLINEISKYIDPFIKSSQGFIVLPIFSRTIKGEIRELIRFHIWENELIDNKRNKDFCIHSHQAYARSWVLAGSILNKVYEIIFNLQESNFSIFEPYWDNSKSYDSKHSISEIKNTKVKVSVTKKYSLLLTNADTYEIPSGQYHKSEIFKPLGADGISTSLFCFDSSLGWFSNAGIVGPSLQEKSTFNKINQPIKTLSIVKKINLLINNKPYANN